MSAVSMVTLKGQDEKVALGGLLLYYNNLHAEYLASYTNALQLIDCQHFI